MRLAIISLFFTVTLGLTLTAGYSGWVPMMRSTHTGYHMAWGLFGWIGLLIIGVSYQVVPMFQVTKPYPEFMRKYLAPVLFILLFLKTAVGGAKHFILVSDGFDSFFSFGFGVLFLSFVVATLKLQLQRKRKI